MKTVLHLAWFCFLLLLFASPADAQQPAAANSLLRANLTVPLRKAPPQISVAHPNASPVSYKMSSEQSQLLADGTRIDRNVRTHSFYRDSSGRVRREESGFGSEYGPIKRSPIVYRIEILDPVAGVRYILEPRNRIAYRYPYKLIPPVDRSREQPPQLPPDPNRPQTSKEPLGSQVMEGVYVEGERATTLYPVGTVGNDRPITSTCDTWRSPDLNITMLSKCSDPRFGDTINRVTDLSRSEPDISLFLVPSGYSIVDGPNMRPTLKFLPPWQ
jgi:hypothetical protein